MSTPTADRPRKRPMPNPFYVALLVASAAFVVTALLYYVSPMVVQRALEGRGPGPGPGSRALVAWLDRRGPLALGVEFVAMLVTGALLMATDHWFPDKPARPGGRSG